MGFSFDTNGKFIGWSDLFDYSTPQLLEASTYLPTPKGKQFTHLNSDNSVDIQSDIDRINKLTGADRIKAIADMLIKIENSDLLDLKFTSDPNDIYHNVILKHENTIIPKSLVNNAYKNATSIKIQRVVQDIRNMNSAYSYLSMERIKDARKEFSNSENMVASMSMDNPLTKYLMQIQNMVGKDVIGIAAVGEKVFMIGSYYYNEGIRSNNPIVARNMQFCQTYYGVKGRADKVLQSTKVRTIANIEASQQIDAFIKGNSVPFLDNIDTNLRKQYGITNEDIVNQTPKWEQYHKELIETVQNLGRTTQAVDLAISEVLSASTDNAKELILHAINCSNRLAGVYLHLLISGFDLRDVVAFMTSKAVNLVDKYMQGNIYDNRIAANHVDQAIDILEGNFNPYRFFRGNFPRSNQSLYAVFVGAIRNAFKVEGKTPTSQILKQYVRDRLNGVTNKQFKEYYIGLGEMTTRVIQFNDYLENIIQQQKALLSKDYTYDNLIADLESLRHIYYLAEETSSLGNAFLGRNQGIATSTQGMLNQINSITMAVQNRERRLGIRLLSNDEMDDYMKATSNEERTILEGLSDTKERNIYLIKQKILANNPEIDPEYMDKTLRDNYSLIGKFNAFEWLDGGQQSIIDYYNLIKGQWNLFDIIQSVPQFKSIFKLLKDNYIHWKNISLRGNSINKVVKELSGQYLDEDMLSRLNNYIRDKLIYNYVNNIGLKFTIPEDNIIFDSNYNEEITKNPTSVDLSTEYGRMSFIRYMNNLVYKLQSGSISTDNGDVNLSDNEFIQNLKVTDEGIIMGFDLSSINNNDILSIMFQNIVDSLKDLKGVKISGKTLLDWFMLYNILKNKNTYGNNKMTKVFKGYINSTKEKTLFGDYFKDTGKLDYNIPNGNNLQFNMEDALIAMSPIVSKSSESRQNSKYIREYDSNGNIIIKEKANNGYNTYKLFGFSQARADQLSNFTKYGTFFFPKEIFSTMVDYTIQSNNVEDVSRIINNLISKSLLQVNINNCE